MKNITIRVIENFILNLYIFIMETKSYDKWLKAFAYLVKNGGHGTQARLARLTKVSSKHINDVIKGRKKASQNLQESIAQSLGYSYEDLLILGKKLTGDNSEIFPGYHEAMRLETEDRAWFIINNAYIQSHLADLPENIKKNSQNIISPIFQKFLDGSIKEGELYKYFYDIFIKGFKKITKDLKKIKE